MNDFIEFYASRGGRTVTNTARILEVCDDGSSFVVDGFYLVPAGDVIAVIDPETQEAHCSAYEDC